MTCGQKYVRTISLKRGNKLVKCVDLLVSNRNKLLIRGHDVLFFCHLQGSVDVHSVSKLKAHET